MEVPTMKSFLDIQYLNINDFDKTVLSSRYLMSANIDGKMNLKSYELPKLKLKTRKKDLAWP